MARLYPKVLRPYRSAVLTMAQRQTIRDQCVAVAQQLAAMRPEDKKGRGQVLEDLHKQIQAKILTDQQREKMKRLSEANSSPDAAAADAPK